MDEWNRIPSNDNETNEPTPAAPPTQPTPPSPGYNPYGWQPTSYPPTPQKPPKKNHTGLVVGIVAGVCSAVIVVLSVLLVLAIGDGPSVFTDKEGDSTQTTTTTAAIDRDNAPTLEITTPAEELEGLTTREIVKNTIDSTVLLTIYESYSTGMFGDRQETEVKVSSASGIVMSADGYIITNGHCVINEETGQPFARLDVTLYNGTVYERATLIGADTTTDLAVIKVEATDLQPAVFGNSDTLQLGDKVVALGNSGGLGFSVTEGILSGLARDVYEDTGYAIKCFQVDAAINPGNSGGPLFNAAGQVIAVNSAKIVSEEFEGIGFSIPINEATVIINDLIKNGYVTGRVSLGIRGQTYSSAQYNGFLIYQINDDSPLKNTDVKEGDLITKVNDTDVADYGELRSALAQYQVGDTVTLTLLRSNNRKVTSYTVDVVLVEDKG